MGRFPRITQPFSVRRIVENMYIHVTYIYIHIDYNSLSSPRSHFGGSEGGIFINIHRDTSSKLVYAWFTSLHGFYHGVYIVCVYDIYIYVCIYSIYFKYVQCGNHRTSPKLLSPGAGAASLGHLR